MKRSSLHSAEAHRSALIAAALCLICPVMLTAQATTAEPKPGNPAGAASPAESPEATQLRHEYDQIQERLETAQRQAEAVPAVAQEHAKLEAAVREAMVKEEPSVGELLKKQDKLVAELASSDEVKKPAAQRSEEFQKKFNDYKEQRTRIQSVADKVADAPEVVSSKQQYRGILESEMNKVEPELPKLVAQRNNIAKRYKELTATNQ